ncbi:acyloxyacyl hydrolase [Parafilimonas sp.]|uniref:acyloxyacyl hydrolase n=1 Tax=Parafilimonas sp. TaxID=1969739 RepID=UPI0039E48320
MFSRKLLLLFLTGAFAKADAQKKDNADSLNQVVLAARYHSGFMFAHSIHVENVKGIHPCGFELEYSRAHTDSIIKGRYNSYPRTGVSFTYTDYKRDFLGKAYALSYFAEPDFRVGNSLKILLRASGGLAYLTNPYDEIKNPSNHSYSTAINSFLQLDLGLSCPVSRHWAVYGLAGFFHASNAGFKEPNAGVNYINASIGLQYYAYATRLPVYRHASDTSWRHQPVHVDASVFYTPKSGYKRDTAVARNFLIGASITAIKQISNIDAITAGAEIYYDDGLRTTKEYIVRDTSSNTFAGLLIGHRFLLNRFTFSQELGFYIHKQTKVYNEIYRDLYHTIYHRWGLTYNIKGRWSVGINLLAHKQVADFIDGRLIYRLR